jgi:tetratricopeptide (TPR) repeat protein
VKHTTAHRAALVTLLACVFFLAPYSAARADAALGAHSVEIGKLVAQSPQPSPTPEPTPDAVASAQKQLTPRERRQQAYTKLLEGQRYLARARSGTLPPSALRSAQERFQQSVALDPTLAEAHTALAEIAFLLQEIDQAETAAAAALRADTNNFGAHRILSRVHTLKSGLFDNKLDRARAEQAINELREVVRLDANDAEALSLLGEFYFALNRNEEAVDAFRRWSSAPVPLDARFFEAITQGRDLTPDAAFARLGEALLRTGRTAEAINAIRRAIALAPEKSSYLELLSRTVESAGGEGDKQKEVLAEIERIVKANPTNSAAVNLLARTQARAGRVDDAVATLRAGITKLGEGSQRERFGMRVELAQIFADALRYDDAIAVYEELLKERGIGLQPLTSENDKRLASLILERIVSLRRQAGQTEAARAAITRMRTLLGDSDPLADIQNVLLLREQGKREEALDATRRARLRHPDNNVLLQLETTLLSDLGRVDEAATLLRQRIKGVAADYNEYLALANLYMGAGRGTEAVEAARKALDLAPSERPELVTQALLMLSSAQERSGDAKGSEETLRRVLAKEPDNSTALNNLGYFLVERNERLKEALEMIQRAVRAEPTNASFLDSLGWAYFKLGQLEEAERYLSDAARRSPTSATILEHLGDLYQRRGKPEQARAAWRKALTHSTETAETARIKAKLGDEIKK